MSSVTSVLIVDDHPSFRATARMLLETEGYDVVGEAPDGVSAVDQVARLKPQLVLLDVNLPDIDGFAVAEQIRGTPVILISSRDGSDFGPLVRASGALGFIGKAELSAASISQVLTA